MYLYFLKTYPHLAIVRQKRPKSCKRHSGEDQENGQGFSIAQSRGADRNPVGGGWGGGVKKTQ